MKLKHLIEQFVNTNYDEFEYQNYFMSKNKYLLTWKTKYYLDNKIVFFKVNFHYNIEKYDLVIRASSSDQKNGIYNYELNELFFDYLFRTRFKKYGFHIILNNKFDKMILKIPDNFINNNHLSIQFENNMKNFLTRILVN